MEAQLSNRRVAFEDGLTVAVAVGLVLAGLLLVVFVPSNHFRARIYFLLENPSDLTLYATLWFAVWLPTVLMLLLVRRRNVLAFSGAAVGALLGVAALSLGLFTWLPEFHNPVVRAGLMALILALASWSCWRQLVSRRALKEHRLTSEWT
jgi:hypothetical protein